MGILSEAYWFMIPKLLDVQGCAIWNTFFKKRDCIWCYLNIELSFKSPFKMYSMIKIDFDKKNFSIPKFKMVLIQFSRNNHRTILQKKMTSTSNITKLFISFHGGYNSLTWFRYAPQKEVLSFSAYFISMHIRHGTHFFNVARLNFAVN